MIIFFIIKGGYCFVSSIKYLAKKNEPEFQRILDKYIVDLERDV